MDTALWIIASLLAAAFLAGGSSFLLLTKEQYNKLGGASADWVEDFDAGQIKVMGVLKVTGAIGLMLPALLDVATDLVPLAASGLMLFMAGAGTTRFRRHEWKFFVGDLIFLSAFAFLAWGRFSFEPFG